MGAVSQSSVSYDPTGGYRYVAEYAPNGAYSVSTFQNGWLISTVQKTSTGSQIGKVTYAYDSYARVQSATDARTGTTTYTYNNADQVLTVTTPVPDSSSSQTTTSAYNNMLQAYQITNPDNTTVLNEFYPTGLLKKTTGGRTYPVEY